MVDHGSGYVTLYQHLSRQNVKVGVSGQFATTTTADYYAALRTSAKGGQTTSRYRASKVGGLMSARNEKRL